MIDIQGLSIESIKQVKSWKSSTAPIKTFYFFFVMLRYRAYITVRYASKRIMMSSTVRLAASPRSVSKWDIPNRPKATPTYNATRDLALVYPKTPRTTIQTHRIRLISTIGFNEKRLLCETVFRRVYLKEGRVSEVELNAPFGLIASRGGGSRTVLSGWGLRTQIELFET